MKRNIEWKIYRNRNSILKKFILWRRLLLRSTIILGTFAIFLFILAYITNERKNYIPLHMTSGFIYSLPGCEIRTHNLIDACSFEEKVKESETNENICSFDILNKKTIFYNSDFSCIKSISPHYPEIKLPVNLNTSRQNMTKYGYIFTVDFITEKIYALSVNNEFESDKLIIIDLKSYNYDDGTYFYNIILSNLDSPKYITLNLFYSMIFIVQSSGLYQAYIDGSMMEKLVEQPNISSMAVDNDLNIYWTTNTELSTIERINYKGYDRHTIYKSSDRLSNIAYTNNNIVWLSSKSNENQICKMDSIQEIFCEKFNVESKYMEKAVFRVYDTDWLDWHISSKPNPCEVENGGCQQLCMLGFYGQTCSCKLGYRLMGDEKSCELINPDIDGLMLYARGRYVGGRLPYATANEPFAEVFFPIRVSRQPIVSFDILNKNLIFASDGHKLYSKLLDLDNEAVEVDLPGVISVAVDWVARNVYVARKHEIRVFPSTFKSTTKSKLLLSLNNTDTSIKSLAVQPNLGFVFFSQSIGTGTRLYRINSDGTNLLNLFPDHFIRDSGNLAIDSKENRLYWFSHDGVSIESCDILPFTGKIDSIKVGSLDLKSISVHENWLYVNSEKDIWRLNKFNGFDRNHMYTTFTIGSQPIVGQIVYTSNSRKIK